MRNINLRYVEEKYDQDGVLQDYKVNYPDSFNFAYDVVDDIAINDPGRRAMVWCNPEGKERFYTFADMKRLSDKTANYFKSLGIKKGDLVLCILKRHYQFWYIALALNKLGAVLLPATFMLTQHDIEYRVNSSSSTVVICTAQGDVSDAVDAAHPNCPTLDLKILVGGGKKDGWHDFDVEMRACSEEFEKVETRVSEPLLIFFSSGTSGYPKMVLHNHSYALAHLLTAKHWHNVDPEGLHFTIADTGWGKAFWGKFYGQWLMEGGVFTYDFDKFVPSEILSLIEKYKITTLCCPPTMFRFMLQEDFSKYDLSSLSYATTAGEALNPDVFRKWRELTGTTLMEGFGQTETTLAMCNTVGMKPKPGSLGKPSPQYDAFIADENGEPCPPGQTGEIVVSMNPHPLGLMDCYYRDEEKTAQAFRNGLYHTGDTAWYDEDGYYWYVGRNDDIIKSSGYRIGPFEIESVMLEHPAVMECAITGVPDDLRGQIVKATVVLSPEYEESEELKKTLQEFVKKSTAPYKYPRIIDFVPELPKTINGKIRRVEIRER
jgi:acetyl-CoA synthetase